MPESVIFGNDETGQPIRLGDIERRSGLYILGKPGMGKSSLLVNIMNKDIEHGHGLFFLDPHRDGITELLSRGDKRLITDARLFDPEDKDFSFGINLLSCRDVNSLTERMDTYTRAYNVFYKLWEQQWGPWLQLIIENILWAFIENQDYTLSEVPMFLNPRNRAFRDHIVGNVKHNSAVVDFWNEFFQRRDRDQQAMVDAALTRVNTLLNHPYVRDIVGQKKTTVDFSQYLNSNPILLFKLSANLSPDVKKFIGTILISELLHAVRNRPENKRGQFCIFVDEFQNFASSDDFTTLITEARKFGIATTIAHVERFGQFAESRKLLGATLAAVNKVFFQLIVPDAKELAPEFAKMADDTKTRLSGELVISPHAVEDIWEWGHPNRHLMDARQSYFWLLDLLRSKPQEKYLQYDPGITPSVNKTKEKLHYEYFNDWALYRSSRDMIREGISLLNQYYHDWMNHKYRSGRPVTDEQVEIIMKVIECFGGVMGWRPTMVVYLPDDMRDIFKYRIKEFRKKNYEDFATRERAKNRGRDAEYQRWLREKVTPFGYPTENLPLDTDALELLIMQSAHEYMQEPETPTGVPVKLIDTLRVEAVRVGMTSFEIELLIQWKVRELEKMERDALEVLVRHTADMLLDREAARASSPAIMKKYQTVMSLLTIGAGIGIDAWNALPQEEGQALHNIMIDRIIWQMEELQVFIMQCFFYCGPILEKDPIQTQTNLYDEEPKREKTQGEMVDIAAQELANLPRFTAYAKVIEEREGEQTVLKKKIKTLPLPDLHESMENPAIEKAHTESKTRRDIEKEISKRQERWRRRERTVSQPPPSEEPPRRR